jgi:serine/threonine protein kinase
VRPGHPTEVAGRYKVLGKIAAGGMGTVYRAEHVLSKKRLALKVLHPHLCHGPQAVERFRREVSAAAEIDHPGIVQVYDAGVDGDGSFYMAMELLEGESLSAAMKRDWPTTHRAVDIVRQVLGPLARAHVRGFVHRDVKPENIFLARDPASGIVSVKLLDFGLTREVQRKGPTLTGITFGTPEYMSPEQCMSAKKAGPPSDVWSVGVLLYELLSGYLPFDGETPNAIMVSAIKDPFVPLAERAPQIPAPLVRIVERCLAKEPRERPQTAAELADAVEQALATVTLADTRPQRTHFDDEAESHAAEVEEAGAPTDTIDALPAGGSETVAAFRTSQSGSERGIATDPAAPAAGRRRVLGLAAAGLALVLGALVSARSLAPAPEVRSVPLASSVAAPPPTHPVPPLAVPAAPSVPPPPAASPEPAVPEPLAPEPLAPAPRESAPPRAALAPSHAASTDPAPELAPSAPPPPSAPPAPRVVPGPARESGAELTPEQYQAAQACLARGDRACAIGILRESRRPRDLSRVIDLYELEGRSREAHGAMQSFVRRFPDAPEAARYRTELERRGL